MRKASETLLFQMLGIIETLGSIISLGTSKKFADVRTHLRKVSKDISSKEPSQMRRFFSILPIPTQPFGKGLIRALGLLLGIILLYYLKRLF